MSRSRVQPCFRGGGGGVSAGSFPETAAGNRAYGISSKLTIQILSSRNRFRLRGSNESLLFVSVVCW